MPTLEDEKQQREGLEKALEELSQINPDQLVRSELGVEWNFEEGLPYFRRTLNLFEDLRECSFDGASHSGLNQLTSVAQQALGKFREIEKFSTREQPQQAHELRQKLLTEVRDNYDGFYDIVTPRIAYAVRKGTDFKQLELDAREKLEDISSTQEKLAGLSESVRQEASEILAEARLAAAEAGVSQHEIFFGESAKEHDDSSKSWLAATVWCAVATGLVGIAIIVLYLRVSLDLEPAQALQVALGKIALLSVLSFSIFLTSRNYRAHRHNYTVNKHRQNALKTFQAFIKAAANPTTKDGVLLYAAQSIFAPQATGYFGKEHEAQSPAQVLEIFRSSLSREESVQ